MLDDYQIFYDYYIRVLKTDSNYFNYKNSSGKLFIENNVLKAEFNDNITYIDKYNMKYISCRYTSRRFLHCYDINTKKLLSCVDVFLKAMYEYKHRVDLIEKYGESNIVFYILPTNKKIPLFENNF